MATSGPSGAHAFLRIFPQARLVCVHRAWGSVVSAAISARPREPEGTPLARFTARYPGNYAAAVAAYWAWATERLLAFEAANPRCTSRLRYEDVTADPDALDGIGRPSGCASGTGCRAGDGSRSRRSRSRRRKSAFRCRTA